MSEKTTTPQRIDLSPKHKKQIADDFNTSENTVRTALKGFSESDLAKKIRAKAKEYLEREAAKITD